MTSLLIFLTIGLFFIILTMWSRKYEKCIRCGRNDIKHIARGLCLLCYQIDIENKHKKHPRALKIAAKLLTKQYIIDNYIRDNLSLAELAEKCGCSRQYIHKKMKELGIKGRDLHSARDLALRKGKITVEQIDDKEHKRIVTYQRIEYDTKFFTKWSQEMAYVLGFLYTDGCLHIESHPSKSGVRYQPILSAAQKEPELLIKILNLMGCNAKVFYRQRKSYTTGTSGAIYYFNFACSLIYDDLLRLGLKPKKSLDITFPPIPNEYIRHFIRGCWDGDGSVYIEKRSNRISASFVSGSRAFIEGLENKLTKAGLPPRTIYTRKSNVPSYYFRYAGEQCRLLYRYMYEDVPPEQRLERKYEKFKACFGPMNTIPQTPIQKTLF